jgi:hypothetical protein
VKKLNSEVIKLSLDEENCGKFITPELLDLCNDAPNGKKLSMRMMSDCFLLYVDEEVIDFEASTEVMIKKLPSGLDICYLLEKFYEMVRDNPAEFVVDIKIWKTREKNNFKTRRPEDRPDRARGWANINFSTKRLAERAVQRLNDDWGKAIDITITPDFPRSLYIAGINKRLSHDEINE